jgi:hypothetical protein
MELEGSRFSSRPTRSLSPLLREFYGLADSSRQDICSSRRRGTMRVIEEEEEDVPVTGNTNFEENDRLLILRARHPTSSSSAHSAPADGHSPGQTMRLALDDDTPLTADRESPQQFQVAYCPEMISSMVLDSVQGLLGDSVRPKRRRRRWHRRVASFFRSFFCTAQSPGSHRGSDGVSLNSAPPLDNVTDWLLHHLCISVSGATPASSAVKWYATFVTDIEATPPEVRLVVVVVCFDVNGSLARVSGITSSKSSFRVFGE